MDQSAQEHAGRVQTAAGMVRHVAIAATEGVKVTSTTAARSTPPEATGLGTHFASHLSQQHRIAFFI